MKKIAVSGCFLYNCRYDGLEYVNDDLSKYLQSLVEEGYVLIPICPEQMGGMSTPRNKSEILNGKVIDCVGNDVSDKFISGANEALKVMKSQGIKKAILKQNSPSCGFGKIYDGSFSGKLIDGNGVCAQLFIDNGIEVFSEDIIKN